LRRVLFLAYYFPPLGGGGVQRSLKFVRYLPDHGYEPVVVTGPGRQRTEAPVDESLGLPPALEVRRVAGVEPHESRMRHWAGRLFVVPFPFSRWWPEAAVPAARGAEVDLIFATMSPFESGAAAARLAAESGKPWVADLRDPWALDEWRTYPTALHRRLELRRMERTLRSAAAIVMNTPEAAAALRAALPGLAGVPIVSIPNGFDAEDFAGPEPSVNGAFRIVHAGWSHVEGGRRHRRTAALYAALGGSVRGLDILPRSHVYLLEALERLALPGVELHLVGQASNDTGSPIVHARGYMPHSDAVDLMRGADLLFLPMHDLPLGTRSRIVPGKTYEYLASGRPILAAVPDGDARDLLEEAGTAFLTRPRDVESMMAVVGDLVERKRRGDRPPVLREDAVAPYDRRRLTRRLAELFDEVVPS
jgi:glycosyltransferase involved in cell wall biosynthesis